MSSVAGFSTGVCSSSADVLGVGRGRGAAEEAGDGRREAVAHEGAREHVAVVLADDLADREQVADVLDDADEGHGGDQGDGAGVEGPSGWAAGRPRGRR